MEQYKKQTYCHLRLAGLLDNKLRKYFHNPNKILKPFIKKDMIVLDFGCGPGVFSIEIARLLEVTGKVISVDMQEGMLEIIKQKIKGTSIEKIVELHKCTQETVGLNENVDFVLMFYVVHEVPSKENLFNEILPRINSNGLLMIVEPKSVSTKSFNTMIDRIKENGFDEHTNLKIAFSRGVVLRKQWT
jgi:ubiquinone/menaquinone biosynthesis C-methylase UbiE